MIGRIIEIDTLGWRRSGIGVVRPELVGHVLIIGADGRIRKLNN